MTPRRSPRSKSLPILLGVLAVVLVGYAYSALRPRSASAPPAATALRPQTSSPAPSTGGPGLRAQPAPPVPAGRAPHPSPAGPTASAPGLPVPRTPGGPAAGAVGRPDPFVPLVVPPSPGGPVTASSPPGSPPSALGLPLPPGFTAPPGRMGQPAPAPSPGLGMAVTGIVGNSPRIAIIQSGGRSYVVGVGEQVGDAVVVGIDAHRVTLKRGSVTFELSLGGERSS
jgi:hypothetical protein